MTITPAQAGYAAVNGLQMYYEIHGKGEPLVLLHGAFETLERFGTLAPTLAETRQLITVDLQAHGRTADIARSLSYEAMADDIAALLRDLEIERADLFGYSVGAGVALQVALRHPQAVGKLVLASVTYNSNGIYPEVLAGIEHISPAAFAGSPFEADYARLAPRPQDWPTLIAKMKQLDSEIQDWSPEAIGKITSPTLLIVGDSDIIRPEHTIELFRLLGGGVPGDLTGLPRSQLAVLPGTTHMTLMERTDLLLVLITPFLQTSDT